MTASAPKSENQAWLLLRRRGGLWGVRRGALDQVVRSPLRGTQEGGADEPPRIALAGGGELLADEILTLTAQLAEHPFPRGAEPFLRARYHGLAVWQDQPVILLDPDAPPPACLNPATPDRNRPVEKSPDVDEA
jgi:hypothetical protein